MPVLGRFCDALLVSLSSSPPSLVLRLRFPCPRVMGGAGRSWGLGWRGGELVRCDGEDGTAAVDPTSGSASVLSGCTGTIRRLGLFDRLRCIFRVFCPCSSSVPCRVRRIGTATGGSGRAATVGGSTSGRGGSYQGLDGDQDMAKGSPLTTTGADGWRSTTQSSRNRNRFNSHILS